MKAIIKKSVFLIALICMSCLSCSKDDSNNDGDPDALTFEEVIAKGGDVDSYPLSRTTEVIDEGEPMNEDYEREEDGETITERFICTTQTVSVLDGNGQFPLFDTSADVIYPGSLLQGATLTNATPSPIVVDRAGGTISYNLNNGNLSSSFTVDEVRKSTIQNGMNNIIANAGDVVPANFQLEIVQLESESQLALELGIEVETYTTQVSSDLSFSSEQTFNRTLVKLNQSYYTMSFDLPTSLDDIFAPNVTPQQLDVYVQENNPATFISSVTYGRIFYMLIESTSSREEMDAKLNLAYGAFNNSAEAELGVSAMEELNDLKIKVIAYGGDAEGSFQLAGETNISAIANKLAESTDIRAGLPLSYVVRSVERPDKIVGVELATEYDIVDCELKGVLPPNQYSGLVDLFDDGIGAMASVSGSDVLVFNKAGDKYAWYNGNLPGVFMENGTRKVFDLQDPDGPLGGIELSGVGAAVQFTDGSSNVYQIYLFNADGFQFQILNINNSAVPGNALPSGPIGSFASGGDVSSQIYSVNTAFGDTGQLQISNGFGAGVNVGTPNMAFFERDGTEYQVYNGTGSGSFSSLIDNTDWFGDNVDDTNGPLFNEVDAATKYRIGGASVKYLFINGERDQLFEWISNISTTDVFNGPWAIN